MHAKTEESLKRLREAKSELINLSNSDLTWPNLENWRSKWEIPFTLVDKTPGGDNINYRIKSTLSPARHESDVNVLQDIRYEVVELISSIIVKIDTNEKVTPIIEELSDKVSDIKLSELLSEFNKSSTESPNISAIALRTIVALTIKLIAIKNKPLSELAKGDDIKFEPTLKQAIKETEIFNSGEINLLQKFLDAGDIATFSNIAHKLGAGHIVDKGRLSSAVAHEIWLLKKLTG